MANSYNISNDFNKIPKCAKREKDVPKGTKPKALSSGTGFEVRGKRLKAKGQRLEVRGKRMEDRGGVENEELRVKNEEGKGSG